MMLEPGNYNLVLEIALSTFLRSKGCSAEVHILMLGCYFYVLCKAYLKSLSPRLSPLLFKAIITDAPACLSI